MTPSNPFTPASGVIPTHWVHRDRHLGRLRKNLKLALSRTKGAEVHLYGPRGCGKTAMTRQIAREAWQAGAHVVTEREVAGLSTKKCRERLKKSMRGKAAVLLFDDAHKLPAGADGPPIPRTAPEIADIQGLGNAYRAARSLVRGGHPLLLVMAGVPYRWDESPWKAEHGEPEWIDVDHIIFPDQDEGAEWLAAAAKGTEAPFGDVAADLIARESGGHLFLLHAYGAVAWEAARAHGHRRVKHTDAETAVRAMHWRKMQALGARLKMMARHRLLQKCMMLSTAMLAPVPNVNNLALDLDTAVSPVINPHDLFYLDRDSGPILDRYDTPKGVSADDALEMMTRFGLFHIDTRDARAIVQSYPTMCECIVENVFEMFKMLELEKAGAIPPLPA